MFAALTFGGVRPLTPDGANPLWFQGEPSYYTFKLIYLFIYFEKRSFVPTTADQYESFST